jgi:hypothetical protein
VINPIDGDAEDARQFFDGFNQQTFAKLVEFVSDTFDSASGSTEQTAGHLGLIGKAMISR